MRVVCVCVCACALVCVYEFIHWRHNKRSVSGRPHTWDRGICLGHDTELAVPDLHVSPVLTSLYMEPPAPLLPQQQRVQNARHESSVLPDQIHTPDVMPTSRHMKYLSMKTA